MTEVVNFNPHPVDLEDVKSDYHGFVGTAVEDLRIGAEMEVWFARPTHDSKVIDMVDTDQQAMLKERIETSMRAAKARRLGTPIRETKLRPLGKETTTGVLEHSTSAYPNGDLSGLYADIEDFTRAVSSITEETGLIACPTSQIPTTTIAEGWEKSFMDERKKGILQMFNDVLGEDSLRFTFMTGTFQTSLSYNSLEHMWDIIRVANYLTPVLYMLGEDTTGFVENDPNRRPFPPHMRYCHGLGVYGGISQAFYAASDAETYLDAHLSMISTTPLFTHFEGDGAGEVISHDRYHMLSWNDLRTMGLNSGTNLALAEGGTYWPDVKLCDIRDDREYPIGKRIEIRMVDRGYWLIPLSKMIQDEEGNARLQSLLARYGFDNNPSGRAGQLLQQAASAAIRRGHRFLDIPYGAPGTNGQQRSMHDFVKELSAEVAAYFKGSDYEARLSGFHHICQTGRTNAKVWHEICPTLCDAKQLIKITPPEAFMEMDRCLDQLVRDGIIPTMDQTRGFQHRQAAIGIVKPEGRDPANDTAQTATAAPPRRLSQS